MALTSTPAFADSVNPVIQEISNSVNVTNTAASNASVAGSAGSQATGSTGLNVSAGIVNQQLNIVDTQTSSASAGPTTTVFTLLQYPGQDPMATINDAGGGTSTIAGSTALNMLGNGAVNVAGGIGNMQGNALVFNQKRTTFVTDIPAGATTENYVLPPNQSGPFETITTHGPSYSASIGGNAGNQGSGNIGFNVTNGVMNMQANSMYISDGASTANLLTHRSSPSYMTQADFQQQGTTATGSSSVTVEREGQGSYNATVGGNAGRSAQGNVAANASSGIGNMQMNDTYLLTDVGGGGNAVVTQSLLQGNVDGYGFQGSTAQISAGNQNTDTMTAGVGDNALMQGSGIGAVNTAAGIQNAQANQTMSMRDVTGSNLGAPSFTQNVTQTLDSISRPNTDNNGAAPGAVQNDSTFNSRVAGNAGNGFRGDLAINSASGMFNQQSNALMLSVAGDLSGTAPGTQRPAQTLGQYIDSNPTAAANMPREGTNLSNTLVTQHNDTFRAGVGDAAGAGATGVVGVNVTSGAVNQQSNEVMYFAGETPFGLDSTVTQQIGAVGSPVVTQSGTTSNEARVNGTAFSGASGVIAVNVSSGALNQQGNVTLLATSNLTDTGPTSNQQLFNVSVNPTTKNPSSGTNNAEIGGSAFSNATGQVTVNVAAGIANQQSNQLTVVK